MKSFLIVFSLFFSGTLFAPADCIGNGGSCDACGAYYLCTGGANDGLIFEDVDCLSPAAPGCYAQTDLACVCSGCNNVDYVASPVSKTCKTAGCGGACTPVPELPGRKDLLIPLLILLVVGGIFLLRKYASAK